MNMKKVLLLCIALCMALTLGACKKEEETANPMVESDYNGVVEATGIDLPAPSGAEDVEYHYYKTDPMMAEMEFELNDEEYVLRAQSTSLTNLSIAEEDLTSVDADKLRSTYGDISGIYTDWTKFAVTQVQNRDAYYAGDGEHGICIWLDAVTGFIYSLSMDDDETQDLLVNTANAVFVPMQGEV